MKTNDDDDWDDDMNFSDVADLVHGVEEKLLRFETRARDALEKIAINHGPERHASVLDLLKRAHAQAEQAIRMGATTLAGELPWELAHGQVLGLLDGVDRLPKTPGQFPTILRTDGTLLGCRQWELLDPRWAESLVMWLEHLECDAPFGTSPALLDMPDDVVLCIVGDWGTGLFEPNAAAGKVARQVNALEPDYTIHLGDVYYAGTGLEEQNDMDGWPEGTRGSFTLNSNHEMYSGAYGYFAELGRSFPLQNHTSYFALQNTHWLVIGLDTAYHAQRHNLYMNGNLDQGQLDWLASLPKGKRVLVMSHHEAYSALGKDKTALYQQVAQALGSEPEYWYWGHLHNGVTYRTIGNFHGRCAGHGAIPYGDSSELKGDPAVLWYETELAQDPNYPERVLNGYAVVELKGRDLSEKMMGEDGSVRWEACSLPSPPSECRQVHA